MFLCSNRVVAMNQRGYAGSDKPAGKENYKIQTLADDVKQLIEALGKIHRNVVYLNQVLF